MIKTVIVRDNRLPEGWRKHLFQRSGILYKWECLITGPNGEVFRKKSDIKEYFDKKGESYDAELYDFSLHKKRAKELNLTKYSEDYFAAEHIQLSGSKVPLKTSTIIEPTALNESDVSMKNEKDDFVMMGSIKVNIIDNLFHCPEEGCGKNFRKENHLQIHIKHYHKELSEGLGVCPNMQDLAYLRTVGTPSDEPLPKNHLPNQQFFEKVYQHDLQNRHVRKSIGSDNLLSDSITEEKLSTSLLSNDFDVRPHDTPKRKADFDELINSSNISKIEQSPKDSDHSKSFNQSLVDSVKSESKFDSEHQSSKQRSSSGRQTSDSAKRRSRGSRTKMAKTKMAKSKIRRISNQVEQTNMNESFTEYDDTRHSFGSPEASYKRPKILIQNYSMDSGQDTNSQNTSSIHEFHQSQSPKYINEDGEVIKIVRMRQEEIINCICTFPEEDGLMIQCELCLCWQHGICNGIERESEVPDKYICYICRHPHGGRHSMKYQHDQEWLFEGRLPTLKSNDYPSREHRAHILKQSHKLTGNLIELKEFLHSLKIKINIAEKKDHPKMYLWSKKWEASPIRPELSGVERIQEPKKNFEQNTTTDIKMTNPELGQILQSKSDIKEEKLTNNKAENKIELTQVSEMSESNEIKEEKINISDTQAPNIPLPEAPIDPTECQHRLLDHIQKQQTLAMQRLQTIEDQILCMYIFIKFFININIQYIL